ncbi:hypothetical protein E3N88_28290 [Mikania micrantha]|uniref:Uncharacterized protein n=1 Tax=Mikania micrantha TaxID=192012 RepID=A0A5N6MZ19_9ASTR|nr:hypothetical protein E3N88_28290 [Mikania micrantha]
MFQSVFNGAVDTSGLTMVWVMSEVVKNTRVMHKLQAEIRSHSGKTCSNRSCPRYNLATSTIEVVVANLFNNIDWKPPNGMRNEDLEDEDGSLLVAKKTPLCLVTVKHNSQA